MQACIEENFAHPSQTASVDAVDAVASETDQAELLELTREELVLAISHHP